MNETEAVKVAESERHNAGVPPGRSVSTTERRYVLVSTEIEGVTHVRDRLSWIVLFTEETGFSELAIDAETRQVFRVHHSK